MKDITFHDSFSPTGATDSVTYDNGSSTCLGVENPNFPLTQRPCDGSIHLRSRCPMVRGVRGGKTTRSRNCRSRWYKRRHFRWLVRRWWPKRNCSNLRSWYAKLACRDQVILTDRFAGVDNVLEIAIVTADGNHVVANPYRNEDLFWALRGGGGGTWGIVTSVTYKTHPYTPFSSAFFLANSTDADSTQNILAEIIRLTPPLVKQGYGGYGGTFSGQIVFAVASPNVTAEETQNTFLPLFEFVASQPGISVKNATAVYQDTRSWYESLPPLPIMPIGAPSEISSWLLPRDIFETNRPGDLAAELLKITSVFGYL